MAVSNLPTTSLTRGKLQLRNCRKELTMKNRTLKVRSGHYDHPIKGKSAYYLPPPVPFFKEMHPNL